MTLLARTAAVTADCSWCGTPFAPTFAQMQTPDRMYCRTVCRERAREQRRGKSKPPCEACGGPCGSPKNWGLWICISCHSVVWQSCWRKKAHPADPGPTVHADGIPLGSYECTICLLWHRMTTRDGIGPSTEYMARQKLVAAWVRSTGFDIDSRRDRSPLPVSPSTPKDPQP